jgi:hypothetical protein
MKKTLLLLAITLIFADQGQAQVSNDQIFAIGKSLFSGSKKQKKLEREKFVRDSTNNVIVKNKEKRKFFVKDSIENVQEIERKNKLIAEKKERMKWYVYTDSDNKRAYTFNKVVISDFISGNRSKSDLVMDIFADTNTTEKIGSVKLIDIPSTEIFDVIAYNDYEKRFLLKSRKDGKICVIYEKVMSHIIFINGVPKLLVTEYVDPQIIAKQKLELTNYRVNLDNALLTVRKLEAINNKHLVNMVNAFGVVVEQRYDKNKFTAQEKVTYKKLILLLEKQKKSLDENLEKEIGNKMNVRGLLGNADISKQLEVEHAYRDYSY